MTGGSGPVAAADSPDQTAGEEVLSLREASFGYADRLVVAPTTLRVRRGEVVAVLGPNGSGKSTLVRGLLGLTDRLGGEVALLGRPLDQIERWRVGYVPQRHTLGTSVRSTAEEIVAVGRLSRRRWWAPWRRSAAADRRAVRHALEVVGLADLAGRDVTTLSGGQQRRVLIARALAGEPDVLVMDEPTAGVDVANQRVLADVLARLVAEGTTMLIVTHELAAVADLVTRVVVVRDGRVRLDATPAEYARSAVAAGLVSHHHDDDAEIVPHLAGPPDRGPLDPAARKGAERDA